MMKVSILMGEVEILSPLVLKATSLEGKDLN